MTETALDRLARVAAPPLVLLRHGETEWNVVGRYQGRRDSPLTATGEGQARAVARTLRDRLGDLSGHAAWSSPLPRARRSLDLVRAELALTDNAVHEDERLLERAFGRWEGRTREEVRARFPEDRQESLTARWTYALPGGGESLAAVAGRLIRWLTELDPAKPVLVMSHGATGRVLRGLLGGLPLADVFTFADPQATAFSIIDGQEEVIPAAEAHLRAFGCHDLGHGVAL